MAKIIIENATITEVFGKFNSWYRIEEWVDGLSYAKKYTVWANDSGHSVGDLINVEGEVSAKGRTYGVCTGQKASPENNFTPCCKATADISVNNPKITVIAAARVANETPLPVEDILGAVETNPNAPF